MTNGSTIQYVEIRMFLTCMEKHAIIVRSNVLEAVSCHVSWEMLCVKLLFFVYIAMLYCYSYFCDNLFYFHVDNRLMLNTRILRT